MTENNAGSIVDRPWFRWLSSISGPIILAVIGSVWGAVQLGFIAPLDSVRTEHKAIMEGTHEVFASAKADRIRMDYHVDLDNRRDESVRAMAADAKTLTTKVSDLAATVAAIAATQRIIIDRLLVVERK